MNLYYLLFGSIISVIICWFLFRDMLSPTSIFCEMFAFSSYFAIISAKFYNTDISSNTVIYILAQLSVTIFIAKIIHLNNNRRTIVTVNKDLVIIRNRYLILLAATLVAFVIYTVLFGRMILASRGTNFSEMIFSFRQTSLSKELDIPSYAIYLTKGIYAFAYFSFFIFVQQRKVEKSRNIKSNGSIIYLLSVLMLFVVAILSGARAEIVYFLCAVALYYSILQNKTTISSFSFANSFKMLLFISVGLLAFYYLSILLGRNASDFFAYVGAYFGGPIISFDNYFNNPIVPNEVWGKELLYSLIHFLQKLGIIGGEISTVHLDYAFINGKLSVNVYTCFRAYIADVGIIGSFIAQVIYIVIYERFYLSIMNDCHAYEKINCLIIVYGIFAYGIFLSFYSNYLFALILSVHTLIQIVFVYFFKWFVTSKHLTIKFG